MPRKPKFRPRISRIKLNPEQAVLQCDCYSTSTRSYNLIPAYLTAYWTTLACPSPDSRQPPMGKTMSWGCTSQQAYFAEESQSSS